MDKITASKAVLDDVLVRVIAWEKQHGITPKDGQTVEERLDAVSAFLDKRIAYNESKLLSLDELEEKGRQRSKNILYFVEAVLFMAVVYFANSCS